MMDFESWDESLAHVGVGHEDDPPGRGSGRYGWGTGENPNQHQFDFLTEVAKMKKKGLTQAEIARALLGPKGYDKNGNPIWPTSTDLRARISIEDKAQKRALYAKAVELYKQCGNVSQVGRMMGRNESTIRSFLERYAAGTADKYNNTADMIAKRIEEKGFVDVSSGTEIFLGVTAHTKDVALAILEQKGYVKTWVQLPQPGNPDKKTTTMVMAAPGTLKSEIQANKYNISGIQDFSPDEGKTWWTPEFPTSLDSKRVYIRYKEEGGDLKDGTIELRPGVEDISLGGPNYAQVRIAVDDVCYMKGMAWYSDDIPKGYDVVFNTNKSQGTPMIDTSAEYSINEKGEGSWSGKEVLKRLKIDNATGKVDRENPFGALIKAEKEVDGIIKAGGQRHYKDKNGVEQLSPINRIRDEGDVDTWSRMLPSQFLSKQPIKLIKQQLDLTIADKKAELEKINALTNPVIKQSLLNDFAESCDADAADLAAKGFKKQAYQNIFPMPSLKDNEIYAPAFKDGDTIAVVRFPHGGLFEIPVLKVNNKNKEAQSHLPKTVRDAVLVSKSVADQLSGADFDGDTVLVIPMASNNIDISHKQPLKSLQGFDPKAEYKLPDDAPRIKHKTQQTEMGKVTNLIADMTLGGATDRDIAKAVRHSMVVIDAEKHHLDYKRSYDDNDIRKLKETWQGINEKTGMVKGASTIITKAGSEVKAPKRKEVTRTSDMTPAELERWNEGKKVYRETGETMLRQVKDPNKMTEAELAVYKAGKKVYRQTNELRTQDIKRMYLVDDAMDLVRNPDNPKEVAYARFANDLKSMANEARKTARAIKPTPVDPTAQKTYAKEVQDLKDKVKVAKSNAPKERQALAIMNAVTSAKFKDNPGMDAEHRKREQARAMAAARAQVGAKKTPVEITDREWEAIQAHAITTTLMKDIVRNTDQDKLRQRATPKQSKSTLTTAQRNKAKAMYNSGMYTLAEIAESLGVSTSTISSIASA